MLELWLRPRFWSIFLNRSSKQEIESSFLTMLEESFRPKSYVPNYVRGECPTLFLLSLYYESKFKATPNLIILWITFPKQHLRDERPARPVRPSSRPKVLDSQGFGVRSLELVEEDVADVHYQCQFQWQYNHKVIHYSPF